MSDDVSFNLGPWPTDPSKQSIYITQLLTRFTQLVTSVNAKTSDIILLQQISEPTQEEWEMAWLSQTGKTMPISKGAVFYWWDALNDQLAGVYGLLLDATAVVRKDPKYVRGGIVVKESAILTVSATGSYPIGTNLADHPVLTFTNVQPIQLELEYNLTATYSSGSGLVGADFLLDGVKQGTLLHAISTDQGIYTVAGTAPMLTFIQIDDVPPGTHTIQAIAGVAGSDPTPPTIIYAAGRSLKAKGYAL